jgi:hypothetical protein
MSGYRSGQLLVLRKGNYPWRWKNHHLDNDMTMWKRKRNITIVLFYLKELEILHHERRGQVKTIVLEHFTSMIFHKSGPPNKPHTYQSVRLYSPLRARVYQLNPRFTSACPQAEGKHHPASWVTSGEQVKYPSHFWLYRSNNPIGLNRNIDKIPFHPHFSIKVLPLRIIRHEGGLASIRPARIESETAACEAMTMYLRHSDGHYY